MARLEPSLQTVMALPAAARSAAITNLRADLSSASAICSMAQATKEAEQRPEVTVVNFNNQWFDTLTARIGYSFQPAWLLYLQGGGAWAHTSTNITFNGVQIGQTSHTGTGWTIGGGAEWMFAPHWSVFLEGNYMDLGSRSGTAFGTTVCVQQDVASAPKQPRRLCWLV